MFYSRYLIALTFIMLIFYVDIAACRTRKSRDFASLPVDGTKQVCDDVTLHINSIQDSRCPRGVNCFWAGMAQVQVLLVQKTASSAVDLALSFQSKNSAQATLNNVVYSVTLQDVVPYPGTGSTPSKAVVLVQCP